MSLFHIFLVAIIQGITEFLPISSSGHLILIPELTNLPDQGQVIDVAVHLGTLGAVIIYFRQDVMIGIRGIPAMLRGRLEGEGAKLAFLLMIATIPAIIFGLLLKITGFDDTMRSLKVIAFTMIIFGLVLYWVDQKSPMHKKASDWSTRDAWLMGLWQALALIPGTSRSGAAISGARALGYSREDGAKIAMLMSIPTIIASAVFLGAEVLADANIQAAKDGGIAALLSFVSALIALSLMMRLLKSVSFTPYVIYRVILGVVLLGFAYL